MSGWYPDPTGRFEYRYHNDRHWTADVSTNGQRYVDPLPAPVAGRADRSPHRPPAPPQDGGGNGIGHRLDGVRHRRPRHRLGPVRRRRRARRRRRRPRPRASPPCAAPSRPAPAAARPSPGSSRARSASSSACSASCSTVYLVRAIERFDDPGPHDAAITSCDRGRHRRRRHGRDHEPQRPPSATTRVRGAPRRRRPATGSASTTSRPARRRRSRPASSGRSATARARSSQVRGPVPFGLDPSIFEE